MTATERMAEIASIFAIGFLRLRAARQQRDQGLDVHGRVEAECGPRAQNPQSEDHAA
jgi:hypothetical protein